jgi:transposase
LDRTQPSLPIKAGRPGTMTHDYKRNGTTTLFAALDVLTGSLIGQCLPRHRHVEFLKFLRTIDRQVPKRLRVHLILDKYATHNHPNVRTWLNKHPRFELHFTPTSSSWLNMVEIFFSKLTDKAIRRGIFHSVPDLIDAIQAYLAGHNENPQPFQSNGPPRPTRYSRRSAAAASRSMQSPAKAQTHHEPSWRLRSSS